MSCNSSLPDRTSSTACTSSSAPVAASASEPALSYQPAFDLIAGESEFILAADMPGALPDSIDITFERGELRAFAKVPPRTPTTARPLREEYGVGDYHLRVGLRQPVDAERIEARYEDGVLTIRLPKPASTMPRKIAVARG